MLQRLTLSILFSLAPPPSRVAAAALAALALGFAAAVPKAAAECECLWQGPFSKVHGSTDLVVAAEVTGMRGNALDLEAVAVLRGEIYNYPLRVWLDTGDAFGARAVALNAGGGSRAGGACRAEPGTFPIGTRWVMALQRIAAVPPGGFNPRTPNVSFGRTGDFTISRCGGYWLSLSDENLVSGNLSGDAPWNMDPEMSPVLLSLLADFVNGELSEAALAEAVAVNPELQQLIIDTRVFLRQSPP